MTHEADKKPRSWDFEKTVFDEKGLQYKLESKEIGHLIQVELSRKLWDTERLVGLCRLIQSAEEMRLSDIEIKNYSNVDNMLFKLLHPFEPRDYRSRGLDKSFKCYFAAGVSLAISGLIYSCHSHQSSTMSSVNSYSDVI